MTKPVVKVITHHIRRKVLVYQHTYVHTTTKHINSEHAAAPDSAKLNRNIDAQYTHKIGTPKSPVEVALEWDGEKWVLPTDTLAKGNYILRDDNVYRYTEGTLSFNDDNTIESGVATQPESPESLPTSTVTNVDGSPLSKDQTFIDALMTSTPLPTKS